MILIPYIDNIPQAVSYDILNLSSRGIFHCGDTKIKVLKSNSSRGPHDDNTNVNFKSVFV